MKCQDLNVELVSARCQFVIKIDDIDIGYTHTRARI